MRCLEVQILGPLQLLDLNSLLKEKQYQSLPIFLKLTDLHNKLKDPLNNLNNNHKDLHKLLKLLLLKENQLLLQLNLLQLLLLNQQNQLDQLLHLKQQDQQDQLLLLLQQQDQLGQLQLLKLDQMDQHLLQHLPELELQ